MKEQARPKALEVDGLPMSDDGRHATRVQVSGQYGRVLRFCERRERVRFLWRLVSRYEGTARKGPKGGAYCGWEIMSK
jgi:hypothetical protein